MTTVKLFGEVGKKYGSEHRLMLDRLSEFGSAMEANFNGFRKFFVDSAESGKRYSLVVDGVLVENDTQLKTKLFKTAKEIVVIPVLTGAVYTTIFAYLATTVGLSVGVAQVVATVLTLVLYAVVSAVVTALFAPKPKSSLQTSTANAGLNSYYFGGRTNKAQQGTPVPIVYGQLKVGSYVIQAGIRNLDKDDFAELDGSGEDIPTGTLIP